MAAGQNWLDAANPIPDDALIASHYKLSARTNADSARVERMSRRRLAGVIRQMLNIRRKARKTAFPPYLAATAISAA